MVDVVAGFDDRRGIRLSRLMRCEVLVVCRATTGYVFPYPVVSWCVSLMMEGYMDFAFAPFVRVEDV